MPSRTTYETVEGKWNCQNCGTGGHGGLTTHCPNCGDPRSITDPDEQVYAPEFGRSVIFETEEEFKKRTPFRNCSSCGVQGLKSHRTCASCGNIADPSDTINPVLIGTEESFRRPDLEAAAQPESYSTKPADGYRYVPDFSRRYADPSPVYSESFDVVSEDRFYSGELTRLTRNYWKQMVGGLSMILFFWLIYSLFFATKEIQLSVTRLSWERQVEVEEYKTLREEAWFDIPDRGRYVSDSQEVHRYESVFSHIDRVPYEVPEEVYAGQEPYEYQCGSYTVNNGDGTFTNVTEYCQGSRAIYKTEYHTEYRDERVYVDEPVYETLFVYDIERWVTGYWEKSRDNSDDSVLDEPFWPPLGELDEVHRRGDETRESYVVRLEGGESLLFEREPGYDVWSQIDVGNDVEGQITKQDKLREVDWGLEPATD